MAEHEEHGEEHGGGSHGGGHGGHGGGGHAEGEHEGAPEWLISFADNVALMMGFFVILLAMNMQKPKAGGIGGDKQMGGAPTDAMIDFVIAMRKEFNNPIKLESVNPAEEPYRKRIREKEAGRARQPGDTGPSKEAQAMNPTEFSNLGGNISFEDESGTLTERGRQQAQAIGARIKGQRYYVDVRGHASPSENVLSSQKALELSYRRALAVAEQLVSQGVEWRQIRIVSCAANETRTSRQDSYDRERDRQNQRVEVIVSSQTLPGTGDAQLLPKGRTEESPSEGGAPGKSEKKSGH